MNWKDRHIGIEIEVESTTRSVHEVQSYLRRRYYDTPCVMWTAVMDGSLRGGEMGWEVKTAGEEGQPAYAVKNALYDLAPLLIDSSGIWRAAVHTHVDVRDFTAAQLGRLLAVLYTFDQEIFNLFSPHRTESNFCVPLLNITPHVLSTIRSLLSPMNGTSRAYVQGSAMLRWNKYSSCNLASVRTFGTVEFRHMQTPAIQSSLGSIQQGLTQIWDFAEIAVRIAHTVHQYDTYSLPVLLNVCADLMGHEPDAERVYTVLSATIGHDRLGEITDADLGTLYMAASGETVEEGLANQAEDERVREEMLVEGEEEDYEESYEERMQRGDERTDEEEAEMMDADLGTLYRTVFVTRVEEVTNTPAPGDR